MEPESVVDVVPQILHLKKILVPIDFSDFNPGTYHSEQCGFRLNLAERLFQIDRGADRFGSNPLFEGFLAFDDEDAGGHGGMRIAA